MIGWLAMGGWALDLDEARELAVSEALSVQARQAAQERASGASLEALSASLPSLDGFVSLTAGAGFTSFGFTRPPGESLGAGLSASWVVIGPSDWAGASAARHTVRGEEALLDWARASARRDATVAYAEAVASIEVLAAWSAAEADALRAAQAVESLATAGLRPQADRARSQATATSLTANRVAAEGEVTGRCAALQALLGLSIDGDCDLGTPVWAVPADGPAQSPALVAAEEALAAARAVRSGTILDRGPSVTATGTATQWAITPVEPGPGWNAELRLDVPIVAGGGGVGRLQQATADRQAATVALASTQRELLVSEITAEAVWQSALAATEARQRAADAADEALSLVDARYREGLADLEGWLAARRDRDEARVLLARSRAELGTAVAELEAVRGVVR